MIDKTAVRTERAPAPFQGAPYNQAIVTGSPATPVEATVTAPPAMLAMNLVVKSAFNVVSVAALLLV